MRRGARARRRCFWQPSVGRAKRTAPSSSAAVNPRTPDGHPDFQGIYDLATLTPLERPAAFGNNQTFDAGAGGRPRKAGRRPSRARRPPPTRTAPRRRLAATDRPAPPATSADTTTSGSTTVRSTSSSTAQPRTSVIVDPPNGRVPALTAYARSSGTPRRRHAIPLTSRRAPTPVSIRHRAPTTIRNGGRLPSDVCSGSGRRRARRRCRCSTTTCTRSCRRRTRS